MGDGWRLPNANELILSYVYRDALGEMQIKAAAMLDKIYLDGLQIGIGLHRSILLIQIHVLQWTSQVV